MSFFRFKRKRVGAISIRRLGAPLTTIRNLPGRWVRPTVSQSPTFCGASVKDVLTTQLHPRQRYCQRRHPQAHLLLHLLLRIRVAKAKPINVRRITFVGFVSILEIPATFATRLTNSLTVIIANASLVVSLKTLPILPIIFARPLDLPLLHLLRHLQSLPLLRPQTTLLQSLPPLFQRICRQMRPH